MKWYSPKWFILKGSQLWHIWRIIWSILLRSLIRVHIKYKVSEDSISLFGHVFLGVGWERRQVLLLQLEAGSPGRITRIVRVIPVTSASTARSTARIQVGHCFFCLCFALWEKGALWKDLTKQKKITQSFFNNYLGFFMFRGQFLTIFSILSVYVSAKHSHAYCPNSCKIKANCHYTVTLPYWQSNDLERRLVCGEKKR